MSNASLILISVLYCIAGAGFLLKGQYPLAGVVLCYALANCFLIYVK